MSAFATAALSVAPQPAVLEANTVNINNHLALGALELWLRTDGQPLAILVNYACHPVVFGSDNLQYSADFPAAMARTVEEAFATEPLCFFLQGAPGDINPYYAVTPIEQGAMAMRDQAGRRLGQEAVRIAEEIHTKPDPHADLQFAEDSVSVRLRWEPAKWREAMIAVFGANAVLTLWHPA